MKVERDYMVLSSMRLKNCPRRLISKSRQQKKFHRHSSGTPSALTSQSAKTRTFYWRHSTCELSTLSQNYSRINNNFSWIADNHPNQLMVAHCHPLHPLCRSHAACFLTHPASSLIRWTSTSESARWMSPWFKIVVRTSTNSKSQRHSSSATDVQKKMTRTWVSIIRMQVKKLTWWM